MSDLDSFFAKKDRKKLKGKKFTTTDEIAKRLEETEKKEKREMQKTDLPPKKFEEVTPGTEDGEDVEESNPQKTEEEWNDFVDDSQGDLTDLKISKLQIEDEEEGYTGGGSGEDGDENRDGEERKDGVWKVIDMAPKQITPVEEKPAQAPAVPSNYVPPHLRNVGSSGSKGSRRSKQAPDIKNELAFPSLSNTQGSGSMGKKKHGFDDRQQGFESVKHGSTRTAQEDYAPPKLSTTNRFDALSDNS